MDRIKKFTNTISILKREDIKKLHNNHKKDLLLKYKHFDYKDVINTNKLILEEVSNNLINNEAGVVLDGFGYFCFWKTPHKLKIRNVHKDNSGEFHFNPHTNGYLYLPTLFTDVLSGTIIRHWSIDGAFNHNIKKSASVKLKNGFKYKLFYSLIKSLNLKYRNKENRKLIKNKKW